MKTVKKVLSVALAVMLVLGTIAVAATAYDLADGQSVALTLKAEVFDGEGAAEVKAYGGEAAYNSTKPTTAQKAGQKTDFAAYKALDDHDYADKTKAIEVKPGQVVWVTFGVKTTGEIYPTFWASSISYTSLFYSLTNTTGCLVTNGDSEYIGTMEGSATANYWGLMTATARAKFLNGTDHSYAINFDVSYSADGVADLDEDIYAVPFYVDPDATVGTTGSIYIPVKTDKVATTVSGFEEGDYSGDPYEITDIDLTGAVLNFKVVGDTPELDCTALDAQIAAFEALTAADYTAESWATADAAYDAAVAAKTDATTQEDVDAAATALEEAIAALEKAPAPLDYTAINAALANVPTDTSAYTTSSVSALTLAKEEAETAKGVAYTQEELDTAATNLNNAITGLTAKADLTALKAALADAAKADTTNWTDAAKEALADAVKAGQDIVADEDDYSDTSAVAATTRAINAAITNPELKDADYTAVDNAIAAVPADLTPYTADSVAAVNAAVKAVVRGYKADKQADVDAMAEAINNAVEALELIPAPKGMVVDASYAESAEIRKAYSVTVNGRAFKIQFVDEQGNTVTFSRADHPEFVTSYTADGVECEDTDKDLAYEIWNVNATLKDGTYKIIARNYETGWESIKDGYGYVLNVESSTKDAVAKSISADVESAKVGEQVPVTVTTGKDVLKVQLLVNGKEYKVFDKSAATVDGDNLVFNGHVRLYDKGENTITLKIKTADGWTTTDLNTVVECVK